MPELPEVETARRTLRPIVGRRIRAVEVHRPEAVRTHTSQAFARALSGKTIRGLDRRGKNLLILLNGEVLRFHFKLWAIVRLHRRPRSADEHTAAVITFTDGSALEFRELELSALELHRTADLARLPALTELGADPLGRAFTWTAFQSRLSRARGAIKNLLTDQTRFAGIGNLWAHEILHRARIAPARTFDLLTPTELRAVYDAIRTVLRDAVRKGGEPEFVDARGRRGRFPLAVYGREGQPCPRDGTPIRKSRLGGRPSFWCPACQR
jgi:formamidopyrimidine-DNA glycosylase